MTISLPDVRLGSLHPRVRSCPPYKFTSGPDAVEIYEQTGMRLDRWQKDSLDDHLAEMPDGSWVALESVEEVSRQNGKGEIINALILLHLFVLRTANVIYSAHEFKTAKESYLKIQALIKNTPEFDSKVAYYHHSNEDTSIGLKSGARLRFLTRSKDGGRGFTGDIIIFDEAFNIPAAAISALMPTLSSKPNPHIYYFSSAGKSTEESDVLRGLKKQGEEGDTSIVWRSFSADPESETDDLDAWSQANPALGIRITERWIQKAERKRMTEVEFRRERLGIWEPVGSARSAFPRGVWANGEAEDKSPLSNPVVAVDLRTGAQQSLAIGVVSIRVDGKDDLNLAAYELGADEQWSRDFAVNETLKILRANSLNTVAIDLYGDGNGTLIPMFEDAGVAVVKLNTADMRNGAVGLVDAFVNARSVHHNAEPLNAAVAGAMTKKSSDGFLWDQTKSAVDLTPLRALTAAWWVLQLNRAADYNVLDSFY